MSVVLALIIGTTQTYAQDHPDTTSTHKHKMMDKDHKHMMKMKDSTSSHKMMEGHKMHDMKKDTMHQDTSIVREGIIDLEVIDKNKDGKVFQDMMDWNVISDKAGSCPVCEMKLKEVTIKEAKANLLKNGFKVKQ
jgi:Cu(I)/Ag(I) efflux system membrane fusion protein/cobalt-zinc-cadmium efflux system membrane fusion protein